MIEVDPACGVAHGHTAAEHHRDELGEQLRDALDTPARWIGVLGKPSIEGPHVAALAGLLADRNGRLGGFRHGR